MKPFPKHSHLNFKTFLRYSLVGLSGTCVDLGVLVFLVEIFAVRPEIGNIFSFILAVVNNFVWNKYWTFKHKEGKFAKQLTQFFIISIVGLIVNITLLPFLISLGLWYVYAKIAIIALVMMWNFFGNSIWTFRKLS